RSELLQRAFERSDYARARNLVSQLMRFRRAEPRSAGASTTTWAALDEPGLHGSFPEVDGGAPPSPIALDSLRETWPPRTVLLSYVLGEERSHLLVFSEAGLEHHLLPPRRHLEGLAAAWSSLLSRGPRSRATEQQRSLGKELAELLLGPVASRGQWHRWIVVPEGLLARIPFGALPLGEGQVAASRAEIVRGPSVSVMSFLAQRRSDTVEQSAPGEGPSIVVFADPVYSRLDERCARCRDVADPDGVSKGNPLVDKRALERPPPRLPATRLEAEAIRGWAAPGQAKLLLGFEASNAAIRSRAVLRADILHLATHSRVDPRDPDGSGLFLSRFDSRGRATPGFLSLTEIRELEINADLVVLSACESGWQEGVRGDGLVGFAQAFFLAGASELLVSLWPVDDRATAHLMSELYRFHLGKGLSVAQSLARAQASLRSDPRFAAPYYWAGFVLYGSWR
ncbi:MAG: CHAT domain-containing protein, partial [Holophagales bacterium]|nr:CHAT domain-containing protein [Holophagales bacterium]